jgi:hypothetical protein
MACTGTGTVCSVDCNDSRECNCLDGAVCTMIFLGDNSTNISCSSGAECLLQCPAGGAGQDGCNFDTCNNGTPEICGDNTHITCGATCP